MISCETLEEKEQRLESERRAIIRSLERDSYGCVLASYTNAEILTKKSLIHYNIFSCIFLTGYEATKCKDREYLEKIRIDRKNEQIINKKLLDLNLKYNLCLERKNAIHKKRSNIIFSSQ